MIDYQALQAETKAMIKEVGTSMTLRRVTPGTYDPTTGQTATDSIASVATLGVIGSYAVGAIDGQIVKIGDRRVILPGDLSISPKPGDQLIISGEIWTIPMDSPGAINASMPGGVITKHEVRIRQL